MEIKPTVTAKQWLDAPDAAGAVLDTWTNDALDLLTSSGFWGSVTAAAWIALKFIPQLAPQYAGIAKIVSTVLAPRVHQDKVEQIEQYAEHYVTTVKVIEDVANQLPASNGVNQVKKLLKGYTDGNFHTAVATITADVDPSNPMVVIKASVPSSQSQILTAQS